MSPQLIYRPISLVVLTCLLLIGNAPASAEITGEPACPALAIISQGGTAFTETVLGDTFQSVDFTRNSMRDKWEIVLPELVLCDESKRFHSELRAAYQSNLAALRAEAHYATDLQPYENFLACMMLTSAQALGIYKDALALTGTYTSFTEPGKAESEPFSWNGDYDEDGVYNVCEYMRALEEFLDGDPSNRVTYGEYATDPTEGGAEDCDVNEVPQFCKHYDDIANNGILKLLLDEEDAVLLQKLKCTTGDVDVSADINAASTRRSIRNSLSATASWTPASRWPSFRVSSMMRVLISAKACPITTPSAWLSSPINGKWSRILASPPLTSSAPSAWIT